MATSSITKNYIYNLIYQMLVVVVPIITTPYVSRVLGSYGVGVYSYTYAVVKYFIIFSNLGVATYGQLQIAANRNNSEERSKIFYELFLLRCILTALILIVYFTMAITVKNSEYRALYFVLSIDIISAGMDISWLLQGLEEFKKIVFRNLIVKILGVVLIFTFVKDKNDTVIYALVLGVSTLIGNLSIWIGVSSYVKKVKLGSLKIWRHLKPSLVYFIPTIATTIYLSLDKVMLGWFSPMPDENGFYEQAHKIEQIAVTVLTSLSLVTMPRMAFLYKENKQSEMKIKLISTMRFILFLSLPMAVGMCCVAKRFIPLFLGEGFDKSVILLQIFSALMVIVGLNNAVGKQVLMPTKRQSEYNRAVIVGAISNALLNLMLIPRFLAVGAAVSSVFSELIVLLLFTYYARDYISFKDVLCGAAKYVVAAFSMSVILLFIDKFLSNTWLSLAIQITAGATLYFIVVLLLKDSYVITNLKNIYSKL